MNKPGVFVFTFQISDNNPDTQEIWGFIFSPNITKNLKGDISEEDWFEDAFYDLEGQYGVHDWGTAPTDDVIGVGYHSYEVEQELIPELMEKWRNIFIKQSSENDVSEVVKIEDFDILPNVLQNDTSDYNLIKSKLKKPINW